ncbi:hypothetical protein Y032_0152g2895 [Ancylostoma ceylanicum]|uniref:CCHC-type domain-containing protein n=1 Tax=Ancylostoma ceylanicum TaxID=53326 RepID=A0A016SZV4_9BILA|nr:hypothetical protein Y032_0152g2895 [Ancylostoma ceylanicum]
MKGTDENASRKCYNCSKYGHIARNCPLREGRSSDVRRDGREEHRKREEKSLSYLIQKVRSMGMEVRQRQTERAEVIGKPTISKVTILNRVARALLDSGSMVNIIPLQFLVNAQDEGFDVDSLELLSEENIEEVYDASNNPMTFLGLVKIPVTLHGGRKGDVAFHISQKGDSEILLGTNALQKLGVNITITTKDGTSSSSPSKAAKQGRITVPDRVVIPTLSSRVVTERCEVPDGITEGAVLPTKDGVTDGVFRISNQQIKIPVHNEREQPLFLQKGEELGELGSEKWHEKWEECAMLDHEELVMCIDEKRELLREQIERSREHEKMDPDLQFRRT